MLEIVKKDRIDEMQEYIDLFMEEQEVQVIQEITQYLDIHIDQEIDNLLLVVNKLYENARKAQKERKIGKIQYVRIFPRYTEILNGTYQLRIRVYDVADYNCLEEISVDWNPEYVTKYYDKNVETIQKKMASKLFQMTSREKQIIKFMYAEKFGEYIKSIIALFHDAFCFAENMIKLRTENQILLTFGNYMTKGVIIDIFENPLRKGEGRELLFDESRYAGA